MNPQIIHFPPFLEQCSSLSEDYTNDGHKDPDHKHETLLGQSLFKKVSRSITDDFSLPFAPFSSLCPYM